MRRWTRLSHEVIFESPYVAFEHDRYRLPDGGEGDYYYVRSRGAVMIVPVDDEGRAVLVRQYRYLLDEDSLEFPAGGLKKGGDPLDQAKAELREEAGVEAASWTEIGRFASWNGATNEVCLVYLARDLTPAEGTPDKTEEFEVLRVPWGELLRLAETNELFDGMTLASVALARRFVEGPRAPAEE
ncbi:MAG: NUDIX hydrolase [Candidatus Eisenbacteria bacterium]